MYHLISILEPMSSKEILFPVRSHGLCGSLGNFFFQSYYSGFKPFISSSLYLPSMCHQSHIDSGMVFSLALFHILLPFHLKPYTCFGKTENLRLTYLWLVYWYKLSIIPSTGTDNNKRNFFVAFLNRVFFTLQDLTLSPRPQDQLSL